MNRKKNGLNHCGQHLAMSKYFTLTYKHENQILHSILANQFLSNFVGIREGTLKFSQFILKYK